MHAEAHPRLGHASATRFHDRHGPVHAVRALCFVLLYLAGAAGAVMISSHAAGFWQWLACVPFWLLAGASLHGISLFTHEAVHGTLSRNKILNGMLGAVCAIPVLQNYSAYRVLHLRHHQHLGEEGDPDHYANYTRWSWLVFCMNWARLLVGYPVYIIAIPILGFRHGGAAARAGILAEISATVILVSAVWLSAIPAAWVWQAWAIPMIFINTMVNIRGMSQHTLLEHAEDEVRGTRSILTGPVVRFFMCNENYHLEHHLYPGVPWHQLPAVHVELSADLRKQGAPYIPSYSSFVVEFVRGSLQRSPLGWRKSR